eukprot:gene252-3628_t
MSEQRELSVQQQNLEQSTHNISSHEFRQLPNLASAVVLFLRLSLWSYMALNVTQIVLFTSSLTFQILLCTQIALESIMLLVLFFLCLDTVEWKTGHQLQQLAKLAPAAVGWIVDSGCLIWIVVQTFAIQRNYVIWSAASQGLFAFQRFIWVPITWCLFHRSTTSIAFHSTFLDQRDV